MASPEEKTEWSVLGGGGPRQPQFVQDQAAKLIQLRGMLEAFIEQQQREVQSLQEKLIRLKHGGGL